jgi:tetratricopeptide (TPR) repeat protein/SAM-dependent methyltransferase
MESRGGLRRSAGEADRENIDEAAQLVRAAVGHHEAGRLDAAERLYHQLLARDPNHVAGLHFLGILALQTGRSRRAVELVSRVVDLNAALPEPHYNLALALEAEGRLGEATEHYRRAVALKPDYAAAHMNLGNALVQQGRLDDAIGRYRRVLALEPRSAIAHYNIANVLARQKRFADAEASYRAAIDCEPRFAEAFNNLGNVLKDQDRPAPAAEAWGRALALRPDYAEAHNNLGTLRSAQGAPDEALAHFREAVRLAPRFVAARNNLGLALSRAGQADAATREFQAALELRPGDHDTIHHLARAWLTLGYVDQAAALLARSLDGGSAETRSLLALCLQSLPVDSLVPLRAHVERALAEGWARGGELEHAGIALAMRAAGMSACVAKLDAGAPGRALDFALDSADLSALAGDPLLRQVMVCGRASDATLERVLTAARRTLLAGRSGEGSAALLDFCCALARQCFINEYVFAETADERAEVERLTSAVAARLRSGEAIPPLWIVALAAYSPLHLVPDAARLLDRTWPAPVAEVLAQQIREPAEEQAIKATLPSLSAIDASSRGVQAQYEENPYPRWVTPPPLLKPLSVNDYVGARFPRAPFRAIAAEDGPDVLVAGCGSGSHAIEAHRRFAKARVLAVDLSRASLAYAARKTRALGLAIEYAHADILGLADIGRRFDVIEAAGSLQCLVDPATGWRVLLSLLKPGGIMLLGLYSKLARADINAARAFIAARGHGGGSADIRRCRQEILAFPDGTPGRSVIKAGDFYSTSDCRDLLFHVQEYQHTLPEIAEFITVERLTFLGFQLDPRVLRSYATSYPDDAAMTNLAHWDDFERAHPDVFAAMYQFAVQKA